MLISRLSSRVTALPAQTWARPLSTSTLPLRVSHTEIPAPRRGGAAKGFWSQKGLVVRGYPDTYPKRIPGVDMNLQERLDELFAEENERRKNKRNIGFPVKNIDRSSERRKMNLEFRRKQRSDPELEKAARNKKLRVDLNDINRERLESGAIFKDIESAAELYGVFDDLFGDDVYFTPNVFLDICYDFDDKLVTPVYRGNFIDPKEAKTAPEVKFKSDEESLWTLTLTNPDGHLLDESKEYLHWMIGNIRGSDIKSGQLLCDYLQPFPPFGTGYHRFIFILYKQNGEIDFSSEQRSPECRDLTERTFSTPEFFAQHQNKLTPAGLAFFQSEWDSSLREVFHHVLNMKEPRYEYHFIDPYIRPWSQLNHHFYKTPFNLFLDKYRDPKEIQAELVMKKLKIHDPFEGDLERRFKYINAHEIDHSLPQWRRREIERERLRDGYYKDLDWAKFRRDPSYS